MSGALIERHEEAADRALAMTLTAGLIAVAALAAVRLRRERAARIFSATALLASLVSSGLMGQVAHLGGQIRHDEIRSQGPSGTSNQPSQTQEGRQRLDDH